MKAGIKKPKVMTNTEVGTHAARQSKTQADIGPDFVFVNNRSEGSDFAVVNEEFEDWILI